MAGIELLFHPGGVPATRIAGGPSSGWRTDADSSSSPALWVQDRGQQELAVDNAGRPACRATVRGARPPTRIARSATDL